jgi:predicted O-methyltransferase YrrM
MADGPDVAPVAARLVAIEASLRRLEHSVATIGRRIDHELPRLLGSTYRAIESLISAYRRLDSNRELPPLADPFGGWAISADMARLLARLCAAHRPQLVVELGSGASTILLGSLIGQVEGSRLVSLEHDALWYAHTLEMVRDAGLEGVVDLRFAPLETISLGDQQYEWYELRSLEGVDGIALVFVDGPPGHVGELARFPAGPVLVPRCIPACLVIVDDYVRAEEKEMVRRWIQETEMLVLEEHTWHNKGAAVLQVNTPELRDGV